MRSLALYRLDRRAGITMLELIVVLVIMGTMAGVVGLAVVRPQPPAEPGSLASAHAAIATARREAVRSGLPVTIAIALGPDLGSVPTRAASSRQNTVAAGLFSATALPDGSVIADPALRVERLTGRPLRTDRRTSAGW